MDYLKSTLVESERFRLLAMVADNLRQFFKASILPGHRGKTSYELLIPHAQADENKKTHKVSSATDFEA